MKKLKSINSSKFKNLDRVDMQNVVGGVTVGTFFIGDTNATKESSTNIDVNTGWRKDSIKKPRVAEGFFSGEVFDFSGAEEPLSEDFGA